MRRFKLNLHLFDGEGASAAPTAGAETSVTGGDATTTSGESTAAAEPRQSFADLIKGEYKQEADQYIQGIVRERVKNSKDTIRSQGEILDIVAAKYGMDTSDLAALKDKVSNDDAYYEDRAMEEGLTVDQYKRIAQAESKARAYDEAMAQQERDNAAQQQVAAWQAEAEAVKQAFPSFDLQQEINSPTFRKVWT